MFKIYLGRTVSPGVGISLPATIEEMREAYSLLDRTDTVAVEIATAYMESSIPNLRQYLYEIPVSEKRLEKLNYLAYRVKWMDCRDEAVFRTATEIIKPDTLQDMLNLPASWLCSVLKFPRSTYYKALLRVSSKRQTEYEEFSGKVEKIHEDSKQRYGAVKICRTLNGTCSRQYKTDPAP